MENQATTLRLPTALAVTSSLAHCGYDGAPMADARGQAAQDAAATAPDCTFDERSDDRTLIGAAVAGHRSAFDLIVDRHRRTVYQVCFRFVGNHEDASDLAQDAFIRAYRAL